MKINYPNSIALADLHPGDPFCLFASKVIYLKLQLTQNGCLGYANLRNGDVAYSCGETEVLRVQVTVEVVSPS